MYGMIGKITSTPGEREALLVLLLQASQHMPGCLSYIVAKDVEDADTVWVTEVWDNRGSHDDSLRLPSVRAAIARAMPLIARFESAAVTQPVGGVGLP